MFKKILVPLDGSQHSRSILGWATGLAGVLEAEIILLSVIDTEEIEILEATPRDLHRSKAGATTSTIRTPSDVIGDALSQAEKDLQEVADRITAAGVIASIRVGAGSPAEVIVSEAHSREIDLIAMATRRESALARGVLGSVTDRVLHSTSTPILILYPGEIHKIDDTSDGPARVIVPLDGSILSETAVGPALEIAEAANSEVVFTEVIRLPFFGVGVAGIEYGAGDYAGDFGIDSLKEETSKYLQGFVSTAEAAGLKASANIRTGSPSQQIVDAAAEIENTIVVMSSHGAGGLKRWVVGSVADKVIRSARRPVLVIPPIIG
ncbi:MAG TPA: universal stress protein [Dehalococcoidia bacterium]|nr:universal stress protein [Dehalococcoidia bacterium]